MTTERERDESNDVVDRALRALLDSADADGPPADVVAGVRHTITERRTVRPAMTEIRPSRRDLRSWLSLASMLAVMIAAGWGIGFHRRLLSEVAGRQRAADGSVVVLYTDGRVETSAGPTPADG